MSATEIFGAAFWFSDAWDNYSSPSFGQSNNTVELSRPKNWIGLQTVLRKQPTLLVCARLTSYFVFFIDFPLFVIHPTCRLNRDWATFTLRL